MFYEHDDPVVVFYEVFMLDNFAVEIYMGNPFRCQTYTMYLNIAKPVWYVNLWNAINNINENNGRIYEFKRSEEIA